MHWQSDVSVGDWIAPRLSEDWSTDRSMHMVVPRGFEAYARVFHPATKRTLEGGVVPSADEMVRMSNADAERVIAKYVDTRVSWSEVAEAFGTTMHAMAQWHAVTRAADPYQRALGADGAEYTGGEQGFLEPELLAAIVQTAVEHTSTPRAGFAAVWAGWGDLVGALRPIDAATRGESPHESFLGRIRRSMMNNPYGKEVWQPGIVADDASRGPRFELPQREYVLFSASPWVFTYPTWQESVLWQDPHHTSHTHGPALLWPADQAWIVVSEIDWDSTVVGGSAELIAALVADSRLEAWELAAEADLTADADAING